jgi:soluble lytic murein transglycosylase-like protein
VVTGVGRMTRGWGFLLIVIGLVSGLPAGARAAGPSAQLTAMITTAAAEHGVPEALLHRIIKRESNYNAGAFHRGHWGLMQIKYETARSMGYRGPAAGLLNPETNLRFGGRYLAGAFMVAGGNSERAVRLYSSGYYYEAKRKGLLAATRLKAGARTP